MIVIMHEFYHQGVSMKRGLPSLAQCTKPETTYWLEKHPILTVLPLVQVKRECLLPPPLKETLQVYSVLYYVYAKCIHVPSRVLCRFDGRMFNYKLFFEQDMHFVGQCSFTNFMCKVIYIVLNASQSAS